MPEEIHSKHQVHWLQSQVKVDLMGSADRQMSQSFVFSGSMVCSGYGICVGKLLFVRSFDVSSYRCESMQLQIRAYKKASCYQKEMLYFWTSVFAEGLVFE